MSKKKLNPKTKKDRDEKPLKKKSTAAKSTKKDSRNKEKVLKPMGMIVLTETEKLEPLTWTEEKPKSVSGVNIEGRKLIRKSGIYNYNEEIMKEYNELADQVLEIRSQMRKLLDKAGLKFS